MKVELTDAKPGEVGEHIAPIVEGLLGLDPDTPPDLTKAIGDALGEVEVRREPDGWFPYPIAREAASAALAAFTARYERIKERMGEALSPLEKATGAARWWLDPEKLEAMRAIVQDEHLALAVELYGPQAIPPATMARLRAEGVITEADIEKAGDLGLLGSGHQIGSLLADDPENGLLTLQEAGDLIARLEAAEVTPSPLAEQSALGVPSSPPSPSLGTPTLDPSAWAARAAVARGGQQIVGLGNRVAADLSTIAIDSEGLRAQQLREAVAGAVAEGLEAGDRASDIRALVARALDGDYARDIDRIVVTEMHAALQQGLRDRLLDKHGPGATVAVVPSPGACRYCMAAYTEGGAPKTFAAAALPMSSVNFRVKAAERVPAVPPLHPRCQCSIRWVPSGWSVAEDGQVLPPDLVKLPPDLVKGDGQSHGIQSHSITPSSPGTATCTGSPTPTPTPTPTFHWGTRIKAT